MYCRLCALDWTQPRAVVKLCFYPLYNSHSIKASSHLPFHNIWCRCQVTKSTQKLYYQPPRTKGERACYFVISANTLLSYGSRRRGQRGVTSLLSSSQRCPCSAPTELRGELNCADGEHSEHVHSRPNTGLQ